MLEAFSLYPTVLSARLGVGTGSIPILQMRKVNCHFLSTYSITYLYHGSTFIHIISNHMGRKHLHFTGKETEAQTVVAACHRLLHLVNDGAQVCIQGSDGVLWAPFLGPHNKNPPP